MDWTEEQQERYSRQILLPEIGVEGQEKLSGAKVLIVGLGGLGSPSALYLAAAGVGTLGLADFDRVDLSNLQRQILHNPKDIGKAKTRSALEKLQSTHPDTAFRLHPEGLGVENAVSIIEGYDFVLEGSDNFTTKYLINDACVLAKKAFNIAGILKYEGQILTCLPGQSACYRCLFPEPPPADSVPTCASTGVLGPLAGLVGCLQAAEALKYITGQPLLTDTLLRTDVRNMEFQKIKMSRRQDCQICGVNPRRVLEKTAVPVCEDDVRGETGHAQGRAENSNAKEEDLAKKESIAKNLRGNYG